MKRAALLLVGCLGACSPADFRFEDGTTGRYRDWLGNWVVINYWAEWCTPCRQEIPELNALYLARDREHLLIVGVNFDGIEGDDLAALVKRMNIAFPVIVGDPAEHWRYPMPGVLPTSVLIAPDGTLAKTLVGPQTRASLEAAMSTMLERATSS